jgi:hypothetical protein
MASTTTNALNHASTTDDDKRTIYRNRLGDLLKEKPGISHMFDQTDLEAAVNRAVNLVKGVLDEKMLTGEITDQVAGELANDLAVLTLYDLAILIGLPPP